MEGNSPVFDILILAVIAGFLVYRLYSVLGRRSGYEQNEDELTGRRTPSERDNVVDLSQARQPEAEAEAGETDAPPSEPLPASDRSLAAGLTQVQTADPSFDPESFLDGARKAFEMIVMAFAEGRLDSVRPFLGTEVYANFADAVKERERLGEKVETQLVSIKRATLQAAEMRGRDAVVSIEFVTEQVNVVRDANGAVVDGDPNAIVTLTDVWTFTRNVRSDDPNWKLVVTRSVDA